ncbi:DUF4189 domain-containing protein [Pseudomonas sp. IT-P100]
MRLRPTKPLSCSAAWQMSWEVMRMINLTQVIDGLHAGQLNGFSLCRGNCRGQEYCKEPHKCAEKMAFKHVYVGLAIALAALSC